MTELLFNSDWVNHHADKWMELVGHLQDVPYVNGLELGVFEGRSLCWWLENIITDPNSRMVAVDKYLSRVQCNLQAMEERGYTDRLLLMQDDCPGVVKKLPREMFDFCYLDCCKEQDLCYQTAVQIMPVLRRGAVLIFDDYRWEKDGMGPGPGIDQFLDQFSGRLTILHSAWQIAVRKEF